jgi:hypothetical protein
MRWVGHVANMGEERKGYIQDFGGKQAHITHYALQALCLGPMTFLGPNEGMEGRKNKNKGVNICKNQYKIKQDLKNTFFQTPKFHYKPTCEMGSV